MVKIEQIDLDNIISAINNRSKLANPTFTGTVTLPSTTSIGAVSSIELGYLDGATSNIQTQLSNKANLASPTFTGTPSAPTAAVGTNTTQVATTAFVNQNALGKAGDTMSGGILVGSNQPMSMTISESTTKGNFVCRATGTGDTNLAGMTFHNDVYAIKLGIRADGYFGLGGWSRAAWSWYSDPSGNMVSAGNVSAYSDPRLKENFEVISNPLEMISKLDGGTFNWKHGFEHTACKAGTKDYGILADQVEDIMPEIVCSSIEIEGESYRTVDYSKIVPLLIESIKELTLRVKALEGK